MKKNREHKGIRHKKDDQRDDQEEQEINESLSAIYGDERDDLQTVAQAPNRVTQFLLRAIVSLVILCIVTGIGFFVYQRWFSVDRDGTPLTMSFLVSEEIVSGTETTIELLYTNETAYPLTSVSIDLNVPAGFVPVVAEPMMTNSSELSWDLGTISAKSDGKISLTGIWFADVPSITGVQAIASYKPANFNAQFHDIATQSVTTSSSVITLLAEGQSSVNVGEEVTYTFIVNTTGSEEISSSNVIATFPKGFFISSSVPSLIAGGSTEWSLESLVPGVEQKIVVTGAFASDVSGPQDIVVSVGIPGSRYSTQATVTMVTEVKQSAIALTMVGNGGVGSVTTDPGSLLRMSLRFDNTSESAISDITALLDFTAEDNLPISWGEAVLGGGKITARGITFDAKTIGLIPAGDHKILNLVFPMKLDLSAVSSEFSVAFSATQGSMTVFSSPLIVQLNSDAGVSSTVRYYDDEGSPLGSGPLPPMVGEVTHYRVDWIIDAGMHGLHDITVSATLPENVAWDDFSTASSGTMNYDSITHAIRWTIASISAGSPQISARMSVSFTPSSSDVGLEKMIIGKTTLRAKDDVTDAVLEKSTEAATTACVGDAFAIGNGFVQEL